MSNVLVLLQRLNSKTIKTPFEPMSVDILRLHLTDSAMFELPNAKRVRRDELDEKSSVSSSDENDEAKAQLREALSAKLARSLEWNLVSTQPEDLPPRNHDEDATPGAEEEGDEAAETDDEEPPETFEFRLFGASKPATTVVLEKDRPFKPGEGSIVSKRPISFYFSRPSQREREEYASVLVTWEQVIEKSQQRAWGLERPWKTIAHITVSDGKAKSGKGGSSTVEAGVGDEERKGRRKRLGKRTRIARRKRDRAAAAKKEAEEKARLEKEEHIKAKKKRLNHVKKVRARAKAKQKKAAERAAAGGEVIGEDGGDMDEASVDISMNGS